MFKKLPKLGVLLIFILFAFFIVEALNIKEGLSVFDNFDNDIDNIDIDDDKESSDSVKSESFFDINDSQIGAPY